MLLHNMLKFIIKIILVSIFIITNDSVLYAKTKSLVIFYNADINGNVEESDVSLSMAKLASYMNMEKKKYDYSLFLNAGNSFYGTVDATLSKGALVRDIFNAMGLDALTLGPKDFLYGVDNLFNLLDKAKFKFLSANIMDHRGTPIVDELTMIQKGPFFLGILGLTSPETTMYSSPKHIRNLILLNPKQITEQKIQFLRSNGANVILALTNLGAQTDIPLINRSTYLATTPKISFIIDGNSSNSNPQLLTVDNVPIMKIGKNNHVLGQLILNIDDNENITFNIKYIYNEDLKDIIPNTKVQQIIANYKKAHLKILTKYVANLNIDLIKPENNEKNFETNFSNILADSLKNNAQTDIAIIPIEYIQSSLKKGTINIAQILETLPQGDNDVINIQLRGSTILNLLEYSFAKFPKSKELIPAVSGMTFDVDLKSPPFNRIYNVKINGQNIQKTKQYSLATTDNTRYRNTNYPILDQKISSIHSSIQQAFLNYLKNNLKDYQEYKRINISSTDNKIK